MNEEKLTDSQEEIQSSPTSSENESILKKIIVLSFLTKLAISYFQLGKQIRPRTPVPIELSRPRSNSLRAVGHTGKLLTCALIINLNHCSWIRNWKKKDFFI
jgi:hypothetical protein